MQTIKFSSEKSLVYLGLGSNQNHPKRQLSQAVTAIAHWPKSQLHACSSLYHSRALPKYDNKNSQQADFYNLVLSIETFLMPRQLLLLAKTQESQQARFFTAGHYADRNLDIDILLYNQEAIEEKGLIIPHPQLHKRDFVLRPLLEIAPALALPKHFNDAESALAALPSTFVLEVEPFEKNYDSSTTTV